MNLQVYTYEFDAFFNQLIFRLLQLTCNGVETCDPLCVAIGQQGKRVTLAHAEHLWLWMGDI